MKSFLITGDLPWKIRFEENRPHLRKIEKSLFALFRQYAPKPADIPGTWNYPAFEVSAPADDGTFLKLVKDLGKLAKQSKPPCVLAFRSFPNPQEAVRARFIRPAFYADFVDWDSSNEPLNSGMLLCPHCHFPNVKAMPDPFLVNRTVLKKYDVFHTDTGVLIVRQKVLGLLRDAVGGQFDWGPTAITNSKAKMTGEDRLFWVRPRETLGARVRICRGRDACPVCKRVKARWIGSTDRMANASGPGLLDERFRVEHFGSGKSDIAWVDNLGTGDWPTLVMSGALLELLEGSAVKGFVSLRKNPQIECVFSKKGEPALDPQPRNFGAPVAALKPADSDAARLTQARKLTASLKDLPWDCSSDGNVYFHLSTPEFVVLDPMTGEEDDQGPYEVRAFKGPGVYALPVIAIRRGRTRGVAVDSASLLFVDNAFYPQFREHYEWDSATTKRGEFRIGYHQQVAQQVGTRFGFCSASPSKFKSEFNGDGYWTIDVKSIRRVRL